MRSILGLLSIYTLNCTRTVNCTMYAVNLYRAFPVYTVFSAVLSISSVSLIYDTTVLFELYTVNCTLYAVLFKAVLSISSVGLIYDTTVLFELYTVRCILCNFKILLNQTKPGYKKTKLKGFVSRLWMGQPTEQSRDDFKDVQEVEVLSYKNFLKKFCGEAFFGMSSLTTHFMLF